MTERNKLSLSLFAKIAILVVWLMLVIIVCAGNWNHNPEGFVKWCSGILFVLNGAAIAYLFIKWTKEYHSSIEALQKQERENLVKAAKK